MDDDQRNNVQECIDRAVAKGLKYKKLTPKLLERVIEQAVWAAVDCVVDSDNNSCDFCGAFIGDEDASICSPNCPGLPENKEV